MYLLWFNKFDELSVHNTKRAWILPTPGNDDDENTWVKQVLAQFTSWKVAKISELVGLWICHAKKHKNGHLIARLCEFMQMSNQTT
jgi:hypothetical protein